MLSEVPHLAPHSGNSYRAPTACPILPSVLGRYKWEYIRSPFRAFQLGVGIVSQNRKQVVAGGSALKSRDV